MFVLGKSGHMISNIFSSLQILEKCLVATTLPHICVPLVTFMGLSKRNHGSYCQLIHLGMLLFLPIILCSIEENSLRHALSTSESEAKTIQTFVDDTSSFGYNTPHFLTCDEDLHGDGSFDTICTLHESIDLHNDSFIVGEGSLDILSNVSLSCANPGCVMEINILGDVHLAKDASITAGTIILYANNVCLEEKSFLNATSLGGTPPPKTTGTPLGLDGAGAGHGGRGAFCATGGVKDKDDIWGGDVYAWSTLTNPWSYGSHGGTTSKMEQLGGGGGGRILVIAKEVLELNGIIAADGGDAGTNGGGGSGGSIKVQVPYLKGRGIISASGGIGWAGGGGGRVAIDSLIQEGVTVLVYGGNSLGCPTNAGAAGTRFDIVPQSLVVSNNNRSTKTDTVLYEFPTYPWWTNVYIESQAKVLVPLLWTRVQVRGQFSLKYQGTLSFGLASYPFSEFELVADEVVMTNATITVYGALTLTVKELLMRKSLLQICGGKYIMVDSSIIDISNYLLLTDGSIIASNSDLVVHGLGLFKMNGFGDTMKAQRLFLSLFYNIDVGRGAILQALLNDTSDTETPFLYCDSPTCPDEIIHPPDDCNLNTSLPFTLQICRVEYVVIGGVVKGNVIHIHRARTLTVKSGGLITSSGFGCKEGMGKGSVSKTGVGGGGGYGGKGGNGYFDGSWAEGGKEYGSEKLPCELGSGGGNSNSTQDSARGGGVIVIGSLQHPVLSLDIRGTLEAEGQGYLLGDDSIAGVGGMGGGSGGSLLFFLQTLNLGNGSLLSVLGGCGSHIGGGGGSGGRVHFHWSNIATGQDFIPIASVTGSILARGGSGSDDGLSGDNGTLSGEACPRGLYGLYCEECPVGTFKDEDGSSFSLCKSCPLEKLPYRAKFVYVRGGVTEQPCPYRCIPDKYRLPHCYTPLEELIYTFGGPVLFGLLLSGLLIVLSLVLSVTRMKFVGAHDFSLAIPSSRGGKPDHSFPFLESLIEVMETARVEESQTHVHRMYFMGCNSFSEPWKLPHSPPEQITELIYEDAYNRFVDEVNIIAAFQWWEGSVYGILSVLAYPIAWIWQQWRRQKKVHQLCDYVHSGYNHACLRSCRSRALYEGLKVATTPDLMLAYIDFFLGGDEKRPDLPPSLLQRLPLSILFGGDGSYMSPYTLHSDNILTSLLGQEVMVTRWHRMVAGLNAQLRTIYHGNLRSSLIPILEWLDTHINPWLQLQGIHVDLGCFQSASSGYFQLGIVITSANEAPHPSFLMLNSASCSHSQELENTAADQVAEREPLLEVASEHKLYVNMHSKRTGGWVIDSMNIRSLGDKKDIFYPFTFILHNVHPMGHQEWVGLIISILLLADFSLTLLILLQIYSISLSAFLVVLLVLPLASLLPFPIGISALFSRGPRKSASLARVYALWNAASFSNVIVASVYGFIHYELHSMTPSGEFGQLLALNYNMDESGWWLLELALLACKSTQARIIDRHIANLDIQDLSLYAKDPAVFWES